MDLEDYFHVINKEPIMNSEDKDTSVYFSISVDGDNTPYPNKENSLRYNYDGPMWIEILEDIIKALEASYGYDIKSKVYYVVSNPCFDYNYSPAVGRELDKKVFDELLAANPALNNGGVHQPSSPFFTTTEDDNENIGNS